MVCDTVKILNANFQDTETYTIFLSEHSVRNDAITGSLGLFHQLQKGWEGASISSGFRSPNVDDVTKVFAKSGTVTVPNKDLTPEYSYNAGLQLVKMVEDILFLHYFLHYFTRYHY